MAGSVSSTQPLKLRFRNLVTFPEDQISIEMLSDLFCKENGQYVVSDETLLGLKETLVTYLRNTCPGMAARNIKLSAPFLTDSLMDKYEWHPAAREMPMPDGIPSSTRLYTVYYYGNLVALLLFPSATSTDKRVQLLY